MKVVRKIQTPARKYVESLNGGEVFLYSASVYIKVKGTMYHAVHLETGEDILIPSNQPVYPINGSFVEE